MTYFRLSEWKRRTSIDSDHPAPLSSQPCCLLLPPRPWLRQKPREHTAVGTTCHTEFLGASRKQRRDRCHRTTAGETLTGAWKGRGWGGDTHLPIERERAVPPPGATTHPGFGKSSGIGRWLPHRLVGPWPGHRLIVQLSMSAVGSSGRNGSTEHSMPSEQQSACHRLLPSESSGFD